MVLDSDYARLSIVIEAALLEADEPSPVEVFRENAESPFVIVCDHAGRALPRRLGNLGLSPEDLSAHIAWDIGAEGVAKRLALDLDASLYLQRYSRLVIDCNRPLTAPDSIAPKSGGITIPGNQGLTRTEADARVRSIFVPYHERIRSALDGRGTPFLLIAMHSFTPELFGVRRVFHAGVLYHQDTRLAKPLLSLLREEPGLVVGDNEPYAASAATDYSIIEHAERRDAAYAELEVRQDLVAEASGQAEWAKRFARVIRSASATIFQTPLR
jgi:predicted N-formylglutamate amidohydrolase